MAAYHQFTVMPMLAIDSSASPPDSPLHSAFSISESSPDDITLSLNIPTRPGLGHRRMNSSVDLSRRNAVRRSIVSPSSGRRRSSDSITIADVAQPIQVSVHESNPEAEHERHAHFASVPALSPRRAVEKPLTETDNAPLRHPSFRTRLRKRSLRRGRPAVDRQSTFLTELSGDEMDETGADSEFEDTEDKIREELFARAEVLLRQRAAATIEAQRMQRLEMQRDAVGPINAY